MRGETWQTYRAETTIAKDGTLAIKDLPFLIGDKVEDHRA